MTPLIKTFDEAYVINLDIRPDRNTRFFEQLPSDWPFVQPVRVAAIAGKNVGHPAWWRQGGGAWGCYRSHLRLIEDALNRGVESILLMEDDALFIPDFTTKVTEFLKHVPQDWGMLYLGGQHIRQSAGKPKQVNEWVYRPFNVNRTHCFALRSETMKKVYHHLCSQDWRNKNHIDHHLGRFHEQRTSPIYCPKEWLVAQAAGKSNISGKKPDERLWLPAASISPPKKDATEKTTSRFVAVMGLHSSGSSALAGMLYHLGLHLGNNLGGYWGKDPDKNCGFEAKGLMDICEKAYPFPTTELSMPRGKLYHQLAKWILSKKVEADKKETLAVGKYPHLCRMGTQLVNICGNNLRVIAIDRPLTTSIESLVRRTKRPRAEITKVQTWLNQGKEDFLKEHPEFLRVSYQELIESPRTVVDSVCRYLQIEPNLDRIEKAMQYIKPEMVHVKETA